MFQEAEDHLAEEIDIRVSPDDPFLPAFFDDFQNSIRKRFEGPEGLGLAEGLVHPHFEHEGPAVFRIRLKEIEVAPDEFSDLVVGARNPLQVQIEGLAELFRLLDGNGKEEVFLVLEILIDRPLGYARPLRDFGDAGALEAFLPEDFDPGFNDRLFLQNLFRHNTNYQVDKRITFVRMLKNAQMQGSRYPEE